MIRNMLIRFIKKLARGMFGLFLHRQKKHVHFWILIGLVVVLSLMYSHVPFESVLHDPEGDLYGSNKRMSLGRSQVLKELGEGSYDRNYFKDSKDYRSSEIENEVRHMGIYRKTLSQSLKKSNEARGKNDIVKQKKDLIGEHHHVIEVTNLNEEAPEDTALEDGYISVVDFPIHSKDIRKTGFQAKEVKDMVNQGTNIHIKDIQGMDVQGNRVQGVDIKDKNDRDAEDMDMIERQRGEAFQVMDTHDINLEGISQHNKGRDIPEDINNPGLQNEGALRQGHPVLSRNMLGSSYNKVSDTLAAKYEVQYQPSVGNGNLKKTVIVDDSGENVDQESMKYSSEEISLTNEKHGHLESVQRNSRGGPNVARKHVKAVNLHISLEDEFSAIKKCNDIRIKRIQERCQDLDFPSLDRIPKNKLKLLVNKIITDNQHKVLLNAIPKTGTSSWKMVMLNNSGLVISQNGELPHSKSINDWSLLKSYGLENLEKYHPEEIQFRLQHYFGILTVRHPFERLESTFREKFQNEKNRVYWQSIAKEIIAKYRVANSSASSEEEITTEVTFEEFLRYVLSPESDNRHWNTYWTIAKPCMLPYQYIAKTETADLDMDYIAATKLSAGQSRGSFKYNPSRKETVGESQSQGNTLKLFSQLNPESQNSLLFATLDKYMNDMELFGYRIHKEGTKVISECHHYSEEGLCC